MKTVIIGTSGHIDLALGVRDRAHGVGFVGIAPGSADEDARAFYVEQLEAALIPWYDDWRTMLEREKPDLAVVAPFFHLQSAVARACLERGIHVFVEKPMATSLEELARLRAAHAAGHAKLCPMLAYRYHPEFQAARRAVEEGLVGEPLVLTAQKSYKLGVRHPMYTRRATYGGTIPWVAIHAIDWLWWFTGGGLVEVTGAHTTKGNRDHAELESSGACFYRLANGGSASVNFDFFRPAAAPGHGDDRLRVAGERGVVEVMNGEAVLATHDGAPRKLEREEPRAMFLEFVRHIETGSPMRVSAEEAFAVSEVALKSREAADRGSSVRLR
jgi:predicted dehydrogenase